MSAHWLAPLSLVLALGSGVRGLAAQTSADTLHLSLGDAARLAAERAAPVLEADARIDAAEARVAARTGALLPSLDADVVRGARTFNTASFGLEFPAPPGEPPLFDPAGEVVGPVASADVRAHLDVPLLDLAALAQRRSARSGADAARADREAVSEAAAGAAALAYVRALRAQAEVTARERDLALAEELTAVAEGQVEAGVAVAIDVTRAEAQVATMRARLLAARQRARVAELALQRSLHLPEDVRVVLTDGMERPPEPVPTEPEALRRARAERADLTRTEARRTAAQQGVDAERAARLPRVSAALDEGFFGRGFGSLLNTYTWSVRLSVPVFDGLQRRARLREGEAQVRELEVRAADLEDEVRFQVRAALLELEASSEQVAAAEERLRLAELEVEQEEERVRAGVAGTADVVRAALRLGEARTALLDVLQAQQAARIALAAATGTVTELP
ncbi:MAG: TolC family protein [Gemmatimonadota bacterium]|nr:TolC family protein [Gemmatimonadota bacterium]